MLQQMETFVEEHPTTKGAKLYSLLPVVMLNQAAYVKINVSTLFNMFGRLSRADSSRKRVDDYLQAELNIGYTKTRVSVLAQPFTRKTFQMHRSKIMWKVFSVMQIEMNRLKFANEVRTDGYTTMLRPVPMTSVVALEKMDLKKRNENNAVSAEETPMKPRVRMPTEIGDRDSLAKELFKLEADYSPDVLIGVEPDMCSLMTPVTVD